MRQEQRYIAEQVAHALKGDRRIKGARRYVRKRKGKVVDVRWGFKSTGRTGAAVRFYMGETVRDRTVLPADPDRQTPRKGAPRGSRRGKPTSWRSGR